MDPVPFQKVRLQTRMVVRFRSKLYKKQPDSYLLVLSQYLFKKVLATDRMVVRFLAFWYPIPFGTWGRKVSLVPFGTSLLRERY